MHGIRSSELKRKFQEALPDSQINDQKVSGIQSATGENLTEAAQIADRWKGNCKDLYCDEKGKGIEQEYWEQEPLPLRSEVARAIRQTASRKATGPDEVPAELFKAGGETVLDRMNRICVAIWETGEWPEEWTFSTFIPLPKKGDLKQCANYRTIAHGRLQHPIKTLNVLAMATRPVPVGVHSVGNWFSRTTFKTFIPQKLCCVFC